MTRVLSEILGAVEPHFSLGIQRMERAAGNPSNDIHLTAELLQRTRRKLHALGLDPQDTTAKELYQALDEHIAHDEQLVRTALSIADDASTKDVMHAVVQFVQRSVPASNSGFALKSSVAKRLLKKYPPKRTMKQLRYRSVDSLLKHESVQHIYVAAFFFESLAWRKKLLDQYVKLRPSDFESCSLDISMPNSSRWDALAAQVTNAQRHTVFAAKELGSVVVLPLEASIPGIAITTLVLTLHALNDVMSAGSYIKLQQVKPDFGTLVRSVALGEPLTAAKLEKQPVPWRIVHQFYARTTHNSVPEMFEPHITASDLNWHHPEDVLAELNPDLKFWQDTNYTGFLHDASCVSLNILDVAINYCNSLPFEKRISDFLRQHLWQEFTLRYLDIENVERAISQELSPQLAFAEVSVTDQQLDRGNER